MSQISHVATPFVHRVVQAEGRRFSLKLEPPYWTILEEEAARQGLTVGRLVLGVAQDVPADTPLTGTLRLYCLEIVRQRLGSHQSARSPDPSCLPKALADESKDLALQRVISFFASCPAPGLLLNHSEQVICANRAFENWSRLKGDDLIGKPVDWHFQVRMPEPVAVILTRFSDGSPHIVNARVSYISPGRIVVANAWASLVLWTSADEFTWAIMVDPSRSSPSQTGKTTDAKQRTQE